MIKQEFILAKIPVSKRPQLLMQKLKAKAEETQPAVLSAIRSSGLAYRKIQNFWIGNMISLEADANLVRVLANRPEIERIGYNIPMYGLIKPKKEASSSPKSIGGHEAGHTAIGAPDMWALGYTGHGEIALTFDTGVWPDHPALSDRFLANLMPLEATWLGFDSPFPVDKVNSHGTHVSGIMLGLDPATADTIGVAPGAYFIATDPIVSDLADIKPISDLLLGFEWALNPDGDENTSDDVPTVINNSWGRDNDSPDWEPCPEFAVPVLNAVLAAGIANVFSAGNEGPDPMSIGIPHNINTGLVNSFTIGATSSQGSFPIADFSSRGPSLCGGEGSILIKPEVAAPGVSVRSSVANGAYDFFSGTSMAAPHTSGAILLLKEAFPELSGEDLQLALYYSATDLGEAGEDNTYGRGIINVKSAYDYLSQEYFPTEPDFLEADVAIRQITSPNLFVECANGAGLDVFPQILIENKGFNTLNNLSIITEINGEIMSTYNFPGPLSSMQTASIDLDPIVVTESGLIEMHIYIEAIDNEFDPFNNHRTIRWTQIPILDLSNTPESSFTENFDTGIDPEKWTVVNPDGNLTWDTLTVIQADGNLGIAAWLEHPEYTEIQSQKDYLISPLFQFAESGVYNMTFDYFYRKRTNNTFTQDTLAVFYNVQCEDGGAEAQELWRAGGSQLYTNTSNQANAFPEVSSDWLTVALELNLENTGSDNAYFSFVSINRRGNNLFVDNVNVSTVSGLDESVQANFTIYPNPSNGALRVHANTQNMLGIRVYDLAGRSIEQHRITGNNAELNLPALSSGVYLLEVEFESGFKKSERLVIQ